MAAGNEIAIAPYKWGGGHGQWRDDGYDCSGSVSYALHGAGLLDGSLVSGDFARWQEKGEGRWITIYANARPRLHGRGGHALRHERPVADGLALDARGALLGGLHRHSPRQPVAPASGSGAERPTQVGMASPRLAFHSQAGAAAAAQDREIRPGAREPPAPAPPGSLGTRPGLRRRAGRRSAAAAVASADALAQNVIVRFAQGTDRRGARGCP